uniref:DUF5641 domain-containing protein n=1 Tax=Trichuris muris TaxID=70415 RepID=A0A5S6R2V9_TRIMR
MSSVLCNTEAMVNARPLTFVGDDPKDPTPLTPSHFLIGRQSTELPVISGRTPMETSVRANDLRQRWRYHQQLMAPFWRRWKKEYITTLSTRSKWHLQGKEPHQRCGSGGRRQCSSQSMASWRRVRAPTGTRRIHANSSRKNCDRNHLPADSHVESPRSRRHSLMGCAHGWEDKSRRFVTVLQRYLRIRT